MLGWLSWAIALASRLNRRRHPGSWESAGTMIFNTRRVSSLICSTRSTFPRPPWPKLRRILYFWPVGSGDSSDRICPGLGWPVGSGVSSDRISGDVPESSGSNPVDGLQERTDWTDSIRASQFDVRGLEVRPELTRRRGDARRASSCRETSSSVAGRSEGDLARSQRRNSSPASPSMQPRRGKDNRVTLVLGGQLLIVVGDEWGFAAEQLVGHAAQRIEVRLRPSPPQDHLRRGVAIVIDQASQVHADPLRRERRVTQDDLVAFAEEDIRRLDPVVGHPGPMKRPEPIEHRVEDRNNLRRPERSAGLQDLLERGPVHVFAHGEVETVLGEPTHVTGLDQVLMLELEAFCA